MSASREPQQPHGPRTRPQALLEPAPPDKSITLGVLGFTLVLLEKGPEPDRLARALQRIWREPERTTSSVLDAHCPVVVRSGLTLEEAVVGQFELVCCDCISVFLCDEIVTNGSSEYLSELYTQLRKSPEFQPVIVTITFVPDSDGGKRFCGQFLSATNERNIRYGAHTQLQARVFHKKGRMMAQWAFDIGAKLTLRNP